MSYKTAPIGNRLSVSAGTILNHNWYTSNTKTLKIYLLAKQFLLYKKFNLINFQLNSSKILQSRLLLKNNSFLTVFNPLGRLRFKYIKSLKVNKQSYYLRTISNRFKNFKKLIFKYNKHKTLKLFVLRNFSNKLCRHNFKILSIKL